MSLTSPAVQAEAESSAWRLDAETSPTAPSPRASGVLAKLRPTELAKAAAVVAIGLGTLVLVGWAAGIEAIKSVLPGLATMKPNTALAFVLAGIALRLSVGSPSQRGLQAATVHGYAQRAIVRDALAAAVILIGALTLIEYALAVDLKIDELLFRDTEPAGPHSMPGRPAVATALCFCLYGSALLLIDVRSARRWPAQALALTVAAIGYAALLGYLYGVESLYRIAALSSMALHTALLFVLLAAGLLCSRPERGLVALASANDAGGVAMRRLFPAAVLVAPAAGAVILFGERSELYDDRFAIALFALSSILIYAALAASTARSAQRMGARFQAVVESAPVAIIMADRAGRIVLANERTERLFGYGCGELIGRPIATLMPERFRGSHAPLQSAYMADPQPRSMGQARDLSARRSDGTEFPVEVGLSPVATDQGLFVLASIVDLTERARQAAQLRQANESLERSNIELQRFAYVASHDLQTPMRGIAGYIGLLRSTYGSALDAQANEWLDRALGSVKQLQTLVKDLLDYSLIESHPHPFRPVAFGEVMDQVCSLLDSAIRDSGAVVSHGALPTLSGDRSQLVQLLLNLVGNALKYRSAEPPRVRVEAVRAPGEWVFSVRDNGIGIAPRHQERIFEIFKRLHHHRAYPGSGIGLAVCRRVVERHGGRIWVQSDVGQGSTFYFTIPAETNSHE